MPPPGIEPGTFRSRTLRSHARFVFFFFCFCDCGARARVGINCAWLASRARVCPSAPPTHPLTRETDLSEALRLVYTATLPQPPPCAFPTTSPPHACHVRTATALDPALRRPFCVPSSREMAPYDSTFRDRSNARPNMGNGASSFAEERKCTQKVAFCMPGIEPPTCAGRRQTHYHCAKRRSVNDLAAQRGRP